MDLILLFAILILVIIFFRNTKSLIYALGIVEIFLHIMTFIKLHLGIKEVTNLIDKYIPESILGILAKYSNGLFYDLLSWCFLLCMIGFLIYLVRYFFKKK